MSAVLAVLAELAAIEAESIGWLPLGDDIERAVKFLKDWEKRNG